MKEENVRSVKPFDFDIPNKYIFSIKYLCTKYKI